MTPSLHAHGIRRVVSTGSEVVTVLNGCDLDVAGPGLTAVVGPSGSGKSSLLMCLSGLDHPTSGRVLLNGRDLYRQSASARARTLRTEVGFVFQQYNLVPFLSVEENIALPFELSGERVPRAEVNDLIERFGLNRHRSSLARSLSGGEQQRTALCRALARRPDIIFADEPTGALDSENTELVLQVLRRMADEGHTVIMVTHDLVAASRADGVVVMRDGRTVRRLARTSTRGLADVLSTAEG